MATQRSKSTVFAQILKAKPQQEEKLDKTVDPNYHKLTSYIPNELYTALRLLVARSTDLDGRGAQSVIVERLLAQAMTAHHPEYLKQAGYKA